MAPWNVASIGTFGGLLWATAANEDELDLIWEHLQKFMWCLRVRAESAAFIKTALIMLEDSIIGLGSLQSAAEGET